MIKEIFFKKLKEVAKIQKRDKVLHIYKDKSVFSKFLIESVGNKGHIYAINIKSTRNKKPKKTISFHTKNDNLNLEKGSIDLIFIEKTLMNLENLYETLKEIKNYLTIKGKIMIYKKKSIFQLFQNKKIHEAMFLSGFKLRNKFDLIDSFLDIYEKE